VSPASRSACPVCDATESKHLVVGYDRMRATEHDYRYVRCGSCRAARLDPLPAPEEIPGFYFDDYAPHTGAGRRKKRDKWINRMARRYYYGTDSAGRSAFLRSLFALLSSRVMPGTRPPHGGNRLLDVGCGSGGLLEKYRGLGWDVRGIEVSPAACSVARERGLEVHEGTVFDAPYGPGSFDLVVLSHVIEHVLEPVRFLAACGRLLTGDGELVLYTPNIGGLGFSMYGSCWYHLDAPRHLVLFDRQNIRELGRRAGLQATRVVTTSEVHTLEDSRHYLRSQGEELSGDLEERQRVVARSREPRDPDTLFRRTMRPIASLYTLCGRGETLEASFRRAPAG
jgi:2-polyprenyl-3-methyl-5-hydroxy-6-metoxy-1,4-benzoquinol methylase